MRDKLKNDLLLAFNNHVDSETLKIIDQKIDIILSNYDVSLHKNEVVPYTFEVPETVKIYLVTKKISGLSIKSLYLYNIVLTDFFETVHKEQEKITANDIKIYLYRYQGKTGITNRTLDLRRTIICTYFGWLASEEYISKNPAVNIPVIKYERKHKKSLTQLDLESIRVACQGKREKAIIETLYSTGCRVSELEHLNRSDVDFETKEVSLFGKGSKHRVSFLNAKAEIALKDYLSERTDDNEALFVYDRKPYARLKKSGIELIIKKLMQRVDGVNVHVTPHTFRHTTATESLNRGMNIVEVSKLLGHENIETTLTYVSVDMNSIKDKHKNCVI